MALDDRSAATVYCNGFPVTAGRDRGGWFCPHCLTRLSDPPGDHVAVPTDGHTSSAATCHCGRVVEQRDPDPWEGRMDDYCTDCARTRCDTTDSTCAVKGRAKAAAEHGQAWAAALAARNVRLTRDQHEQVVKKYPMRGIRWWPKGNTGSYGWQWTGERPVPRWIARLVKRNTFYFNLNFQVGLSVGFVARWKIRYALSFIQSWARITGRHPILVAEQFTKDGREIVQQEVEKRV